MNKKKQSMPVIFGFLAAISFFSLLIAVYPAIIPQLDLSSTETSNIGSTIGGVVGPIVGIFSAYLLFEALTAQREANDFLQVANNDQRMKADLDIVFVLLNQLEKEYDSFDSKQTKGAEKIILTGYDAISSFCYTFKEHSTEEGMYKVFKDSVNGMRMMYLLRSFTLIRDQIESSSLNGISKALVEKKLDYYYRAKFKYPILFLTRGFHEVEDTFIEEIRTFQALNDVIE
ncbi:hypothetical protein [Pedobacter sp.]|uniref:hypothetical protein n=1 Tax=Pedobacter sp. TaxID=1411316 RepID=UPI003D7F9FD9